MIVEGLEGVEERDGEREREREIAVGVRRWREDVQSPGA